MDDAAYERSKERIRACWDKWSGATWLDNDWRIRLDWKREPNTEFPSRGAEIEPDWQYLMAIVTFFVPVCDDIEDDELDLLIAHEIVHAFVAELVSPAGTRTVPIAQEERVVETLGRAIVHVWERAVRDGSPLRTIPPLSRMTFRGREIQS